MGFYPLFFFLKIKKDKCGLLVNGYMIIRKMLMLVIEQQLSNN
jgi:hypothetical protein